MIELTQEQWQAIAREENLTMIEPESKTAYVVVRKDLYDKLRTMVDQETPPDSLLDAVAAKAARLFEKFRPLVEKSEHCEIVICPPYVDLGAAVQAVQNSNVAVGSQNVHWKNEGAFTGEISASMLLALGVTHVIVGHSERRQYFGETDDTVNLRLKASLEAGLSAICCVGEVLEEREAGLTEPEIEALRAGTDPGFADKQEQVAYSVVRALTGPGADLDDQEYDTAVAVLGEQALVELSTLVGYYATLALQLRIFRVPAP